MTERTQTRRQQRKTTAARHDLADTISRAVIRAVPAWHTCRKCRALFRASVYWPECYLCWLTSHDTRPA